MRSIAFALSLFITASSFIPAQEDPGSGTCPVCGTVVEPDWSYCPRDATPIGAGAEGAVWTESWYRVIVYPPDEGERDPTGERASVRLDRRMLERIRSIPGVVEAVPDLAFMGTLRLEGRALMVVASCLPPTRDPRAIQSGLLAGRIPEPGPAILVAKSIHDALAEGGRGLVGEEVLFEYLRGSSEGAEHDLEAGRVELTIAGVLDDSGHAKRFLGLKLVHSSMVVLTGETCLRLWQDGVAAIDSRMDPEDDPADRPYPSIILRFGHARDLAPIRRALDELGVDHLHLGG